MNKMFEYGFICTDKNEKVLINNLLNFLEPMNRTFSKTKNKSLLEGRLPYVYKHYYWNLNKEKQVYVEVYHVAIEEQEKYLHDLLSSSSFEFVKLYEYSNGEERL